jgi:hypothetical protein
MVGAGAGGEIFEKLELEPHKNGPVPQHWLQDASTTKKLPVVPVISFCPFELNSNRIYKISTNSLQSGKDWKFHTLVHIVQFPVAVPPLCKSTVI